MIFLPYIFFINQLHMSLWFTAKAICEFEKITNPFFIKKCAEQFCLARSPIAPSSCQGKGSEVNQCPPPTPNSAQWIVTMAWGGAMDRTSYATLVKMRRRKEHCGLVESSQHVIWGTNGHGGGVVLGGRKVTVLRLPSYWVYGHMHLETLASATHGHP
jgi:hypothetical protein